ncbi:MAG: hypothetical protein V3U87_14920 [Methylococcaceae bacterium]
MRLKSLSLLASFILLTACGGGGGGTPSKNDNDNGDSNGGDTPSTQEWKAVSFDNERGEPTTGFQQMVRQGDDMYFANTIAINRTGFHLFKSSDLVNSKKYYMEIYPDSLVFVDELEYIRFWRSYSENGTDFIQATAEKNGKSFRSYSGWKISVAGNSSAYLMSVVGLRNSSSAYISYDQGMSYNDPLDGFNTKYSVTGTEFGFDGINTFLIPTRDDGLLVSRDLGKTWSSVLTTTKNIEAVAANKFHSNTFFAARRGELYRSLDAGINWNKVNQPLHKGSKVLVWSDIELLDDGTLIALASPESLGAAYTVFYESKDLGQSWKQLGEPIQGTELFSFYNGNIEGTKDFYLIQAQFSAISHRKRK